MGVQYDGLDVETIVSDISRRIEERARKKDEAGKRIQDEMLPEVSGATPVRQRGGDCPFCIISFICATAYTENAAETSIFALVCKICTNSVCKNDTYY